MSEKLNRIFNEDNCISEENLLAYINGTLSSADQHRIEEHLLDCELCNDAFEGLQLMKNPSGVISISNELNNLVDEIYFSEEEAKIKVIFPWQMAAAFALLIISGLTLWFFIPKKDSQQLFTQEYKPFPVKENKVNEQIKTEQEIAPLNAPSTTETQYSHHINSTVRPEEIEVKQQKDVIAKVTDKDKSAEQSINEERVAEIKEPSREIPVAAMERQTFSMKSAPAAATTQMDENADKKTGITANSISAYEQGLNAYTDGNYQLAVDILNNEKDHIESLFYAGVSYLSLGKAQEAINKLEDFRKKGSHELTEASWWYEALANIKLDNKKEAAKCLKEVINLNASYKSKAEQLLQKI